MRRFSWPSPGLIGLTLLLLSAAAGCRTTAAPQGHPFVLALTSPGVCVVEGREIETEQLPAQLKRLRLPGNTPIIVELPPSIPAATMRDFTRRLTRAGYPSVMFKRPRHAAATVAPPGGH